MCKVRNITAINQGKCYCGSWLKHWENYSGKKSPRCSIDGCGNKAVVGAHVQKREDHDYNSYIMPLCASCNRKLNEFETSENLISANIFETCGY